MAKRLVRKAEDNITPFWEIIPRFFLFPVRGYGSIAILLFSILWTFLATSLFQIVVIFAVLKYALEVLQVTADGGFDAPELSVSVLTEGYELPVKQVGLFIMPAVIMILVNSLMGYIIAIGVFILYLIALPASIMTLAYTHSFFAAVNPLQLGSLINRIGWPYAILYGFLLLLNGGSTAAYYFVEGTISGTALVFFGIISQIYFGLVMYAMMGYVLYQYHGEIGYAAATDFVVEDTEPVRDINSFESLVEKQDYPGARDMLKEMILQDPDNLELRKKFHKIIKILGDSAQLVYHGLGMIGRLLAANQPHDAVNVYLDCIKADPNFKPESDAHYLPLVTAMRKDRLYKQALQLANGFHKLYPGNAAIPDLYLLIARIMMEDLSEDEKARPILAFLKKNYPDHKTTPEVDTLNAVLARI